MSAGLPPLHAPGTVRPQDLLVAAVVEVLGKPAQQFRKLQGRFIRAGGLVLEEAGEIDGIVHDILRVLLGTGIGFDNILGPEAVALDEDDLGVV